MDKYLKKVKIKMFNNIKQIINLKKQKKELIDLKKEVEIQQENLKIKQRQYENAKYELEKIQSILNDASEKIDISNILALKFNGTIYFTYMDVAGRMYDYFNKNVKFDLHTGYRSVESYGYKIINYNIVERAENWSYYTLEKVSDIFLLYPDRKVPIEIFMKVYYQLNNVDIKKIKAKNR